MEELRQQIQSLQARVEEKEQELMLIQQELSLLKARLEDAISQNKIEELKADQDARLKEKARVQAEQARLAAEQAEALAAEKEIQTQQENAARIAAETDATSNEDQETKADDEAPVEIPHVGEAEHEAIMRTIEEMSRSMGIQDGEGAGARFEERPTLGDKVSRQKLNDIKRGLGINERFLYANELFAGDMGAFSQAVEELNHVDSESDANRLLNENLATRYRWDEEDETVVAFKSLVSRRFT
jgi:hypothetical protein